MSDFPSPLSSAASTPVRTSLYDLPFREVEARLAYDGVRPVHARALWRALYEDGAEALGMRTDLPPPLRRWLRANLVEADAPFGIDGPTLHAATASEDGRTHKLLLRLNDGQTIETVVMAHDGRYTACLSTQAGCAMGCVFCATGQMGFVRQLRPGEIVTQVVQVVRRLRASRAMLRNLVLMGMGEPLHNYDAVMTALEIVSDRRGLNLGPSRITISTVGLVPAILQLAAERRPYHLAVSLHGATDAVRNALVPIGLRWPLADLLAACRTYAEQTGRKIFFEWTLIAGVNDTPTQARALTDLLNGLQAHVNLIPLNSTGGFDGCPSAIAAARDFQGILRTAAIPSTIRVARGIDATAGCGMLRSEARSGRPAEAARRSTPNQPLADGQPDRVDR